MVFDIQVGSYKLMLLSSVQIHKSVDLLAGTCSIVAPGTAYNEALDVEKYIKVGDKVTVKLGYENISADTKPEFEGYLQRIATDSGVLTLICEDSIYLTRKAVADKTFNGTTAKAIAEYVANEVGGLTVSCTYDFQYSKFVIFKATGYDVLKKLQDETKANIYVKDETLHIHPAYIEKFGEAKYDFARNIEKDDLVYKRAEDRKYQVEVESIGVDNKRVTEIVGDMGGNKRSIKLYGVTDRATMRKRGEEELKRIVYDGYEGSITTWLIPYVEPGYSASVYDEQYEYKNGIYYVVAVTTTFSDTGGVRDVELGIKLS